jgi:AraC-like DNA-binding protein
MKDVRRQFVLGFLAYAVQRNVEAGQLCSLAGIDIKKLQGKGKYALSSTHVDRLWHHAIYLTNDSLLALHFGESLQLSALGVVGQVIQLSSTVGEALQKAASFAHLLEERVSIEVKPSANEFRVSFVMAGDVAEQQKTVVQKMIELLMVFTLHELDGLLLTRLKPISVGFPRLPQATAEYQRIFRCNTFRKSKHAFLSFSSVYWNASIITADYQLQNSLLKSIHYLQPKSSTTALQSKIYNYLLANAYLGIPTLEAIAANMNTSARSLQRRLQQEGTTYQLIADEVRKSLALYYLQSKNHAIKEVTYMLGYNDISAFTRAFRRWTGNSPAQFQKL